MIKRGLNTCLNCKLVTNKGIWKVEINKGPLSVQEEFNVESDIIDYEYFCLDNIDAKALADKYQLTEDEAEQAILDGEAICPNCKSILFFSYSESLDGDLLIDNKKVE